MAFVKVPPEWVVSRGYVETAAAVPMNAAGESSGAVGLLHLPDHGDGGTRTISAVGGGGIYINTASGNVFADGTSNLRLGLQDVTGTTGLEDGTFDVHADLVGGVHTLPTNVLQFIPMTSGSKTLAHNQKFAIVAELTARGGADVVQLDRVTGAAPLSFGYPYGTADVGTLQKANEMLCALIKFDDDTFGWISRCPLLVNYAAGRSVAAINTGTTPDEYVAAFQLGVPLLLTGMGLKPEAIGTSDTFEMILYSDPFGSPVAERTWTPDPDELITGEWLTPSFDVPFEAAADTDYAIGLRPTSANSINWSYYDNTTGFEDLKAASFFSVIKMASRVNNAGPFTETQVYHVPEFAIEIGGYEDGGGGGSPSPGGSRSYGWVG